MYQAELIDDVTSNRRPASTPVSQAAAAVDASTDPVMGAPPAWFDASTDPVMGAPPASINPDACTNCTDKCGDGIVAGDEECDVALAAGQPGACPTSCPPLDACTPQTLTGSACSIECVPSPISAAGPKDGCCPPKANALTDADCSPSCGNGVIEGDESCDPKSSCTPCDQSDPCRTSSSTGAADSCNLRCKSVPITQCQNGDRCCPSGCSRNNDRDCSASCGNGVVETGESCENGSGKPCPTNCDDADPCTADTLLGSSANCNAACSHVAITQATNRDGCCPSGVSANDDDDCAARCGNKAIEAGEQCDDGNEVAGDGCSNCQADSGQDACLGKLNTSPQCAQCSCSQCGSYVLACQGANTAGDAALCNALVECAHASGCRDPDCLCGTANTVSCASGGANGPCRQQVMAAAKTNSVFEIQMRAQDTSYPIGRANVLGVCIDDHCRTECGR